MSLPQVYMCSPFWTLLPSPSPYHPSDQVLSYQTFAPDYWSNVALGSKVQWVSYCWPRSKIEKLFSKMTKSKYTRKVPSGKLDTIGDFAATDQNCGLGNWVQLLQSFFVPIFNWYKFSKFQFSNLLKIYIYLFNRTRGLSWGMWDLQASLQHVGSLVVAGKLLVAARRI